MRLLRGAVPVAGTARLLQGSGSVVAFIPDAPLARNTGYRLVVSRAVRDLEGDALDAGVTVAFTTGQSSTGPAASITVSPDTVRMTGATYQMTATVRDAAGNELIDQPVTWSTSDPTGLTVSPTGLVTALAAGSYDVTATVNGIVGSAQVIVSAGPPASVTVSPTQASVGAAGDTIILTATARDAARRLLDRPSFTWSSSDPAVATVAADSSSSLGRAFATVTGVSPGSATITATSGTASGTAAVMVIPPPPVASVTVTPDSAWLLVQARVQLSATVRDANGKSLGGRLVSWASDNTSVATVDANGLVTGVSVGAAAVIATSEGLSDTAAITVTVITFVSVSPGGWHTCGLTTMGAAYCWGLNVDGQLGDGSTINRSVPVAVAGGLTFSALSAGSSYSCGLTTTGGAYCWGQGRDGRLGDGSTVSRLVPTAVASGLTLSGLSAGGDHTCGLSLSGAAYCWGVNDLGQLGDGSNISRLVPTAVATGLTFSALSAATGPHTCGLATNRAVYCWGFNGEGQLGDGSTSDRTMPVPVSGRPTFSSLSTGYLWTCGVTANGTAYCWGYGAFGQLGDGSPNSSSVPVAVTGGLTFSAVSAAGVHTCGLTTNGAAYCWGVNLFGQLGDGSTNWSLVPVAVAGGLTFASLSEANADHSCGFTIAGIAYCWGQNSDGQLGNGSTTNSNVPAKVAGQP